MNRLIFLSVLAAAGWIGNAIAAYNANMSGEVQAFYAYADGDYIYFRLKNQPSSHPTCNPNHFVIAETVPAERRRAMLTRLALAYALKEPVNIGYDNVGECAHGYIRVHRVG